MAHLLKGAPVVEAMNEAIGREAAMLKECGVIPALAIVRVGEREDDISYERGATKRCEKAGVEVRSIALAADTSQDDLIRVIEELNRDEKVHGVLLFRPLPKHIDDDAVRNVLAPEKDVDGITDLSLAGVFANTDTGYSPCTPQACMEIFEHYGIDLKGKKAVVIGRSLVVGKPAAMMLLARNATVTVCHTRTADMPAICREAEVLIVSAGRAGILDKSYLAPGQIVIDVGIHVKEDGSLCGDVKFEDADAIAEAVTPVPGGVGTVTTSVLVKHVVEAAKKRVEAAK
ncbi:MAG: bifunctional 5,10-methylenetetrahydrofolate dehydrogenase/5,10-methenyltetrahydrofolate cyclohydrolase [Clostridiaceae bacterium]|nr:bifunctional 5,10-methylenetetrahydrofolate dehydrogenase/5,10-methenyltetrahydrofolate cyclohydrolase [Eubacteriales bacterium]